MLTKAFAPSDDEHLLIFPLLTSAERESEPLSPALTARLVQMFSWGYMQRRPL